LQKKYLDIAMTEAGVVANDAHDRKLMKSLGVCRGRAFTLCHWLGSRLEVPPTQYMRQSGSGPRWKVLQWVPCVFDSPQPLLSGFSESTEELSSSCDRSSVRL
jgi:hypothetical protein